jgi:Predicted nucleotide-utilizing enzyme related to molybdopterin-biosynthesis enzyme MoeA
MKKRNKKITAGILVIGNEILSGRTIDQNISFLALWLNNNLGIKVSEVRMS